MGIRLVDSFGLRGLNTSHHIPVFVDDFRQPQYGITKDTIKRALQNATIDEYKLVDNDTGFTLHVEGPNTLALFRYFFEGDNAEEIKLAITPEDPEALEAMGEFVPEFLSNLKLQNPTHIQATEKSIIMVFYTRADYYQAIKTLEAGVQEETRELQATGPKRTL